MPQAGAARRGESRQPAAAAAREQRRVRSTAQRRSLSKPGTTSGPEGAAGGLGQSKGRPGDGLGSRGQAQEYRDLVPLTFWGSSQRRLSQEIKPG